MEVRTPRTTASRLAAAERALREQWSQRNLYLPLAQITPTLAARKRNARSALHWYIGEIRSLRSPGSSLAPARSGDAAGTRRDGAASGHPVQIWTRAVATSRPGAIRASWIPIAGFDSEQQPTERP